MRNQIYYLLDLHKKCSLIITYDDNKTINKFCNLLIMKYINIFRCV